MSADISKPSALTDSRQRLFNVYEQDNLWLVLDAGEPWLAHDLPYDNRKAQALMNRLRAMGAVTIVDTVVTDAELSNRGHVYEWSDGIRELLEDYRQREDRFACNHRAHVHHRDDGQLGCKYCDDAVVYDRATVRGLIA